MGGHGAMAIMDRFALMALAGLLGVVPSPEAREAYEMLRKSGAPHIDPNSIQNAPKFNIVSRPSHS